MSGRASGRPFRFLAGLMALWVGMRVFQLWPVEEVMSEALVTPVAAMGGARQAGASARAGARDPGRLIRLRGDGRGSVAERSWHAQRLSPRLSQLGPGLRRGGALGRLDRTLASAIDVVPRRADRVQGRPAVRGEAAAPGPVARRSPAATTAPAAHAVAGLAEQAATRNAAAWQGAPLSPEPLSPAPGSRLRGSGWLIVRGGEAAPFVPQLGGSQAGVRLTYALDPDARLSVAGRLSTALRGRQREAAIGLDWQPTRLPVHVIVEQRIGIEQARGGPALGLIGGFGPSAVGGGLMLDGYGQAGVIVRDGGEGFADGAVRVSRGVAVIESVRLELGLGAWGAAQRGAARLDVGPSASAVLPVAGARLRVSLEWRARLAGAAAPASGPALSIGTDF